MNSRTKATIRGSLVDFFEEANVANTTSASPQILTPEKEPGEQIEQETTDALFVGSNSGSDSD